MPAGTPKSAYKPRRQFSRLDARQVKDAAAGRWNEILVTVAGLPLESLDGRKHPCPKCGGTDRFRLWKPDAGGVRCNHCFDDQNGDGLAAVQWSLGIGFRAALKLVAEHLGIEGASSIAIGKGSRANGRGKAGPGPASATSDTKPKKSPDANLKFVPWNNRLAAWWAAKKPPIKPEVIQSVGARMAVYRSRWKVIAIPVWRLKPGDGDGGSKPCGWALYEINAGKLPVYEGRKISRWEKTKTTSGSTRGVSGVMR